MVKIDMHKKVRRNIIVPNLPVWRDYIPARYDFPSVGDQILLSNGTIATVTDAKAWVGILILIVRKKKHMLNRP